MKYLQTLVRSSAVVGGVLLAGKCMRRDEEFDFQGRVVLITGGSRGLGLLIARILAGEGARLAIVARDEAELERAAQELAAGAEVLAFSCDVRDRGQAEDAVARVVEHYGRLDVLINNAGIIQAGPLEHMALKDFEDAMATHLWGPFYTMEAAVPQMRRQGGGRIVNIASIGGKVAVPHLVPYCASKFALVGLSDGMRAELAKDNIAITTVCPGLMRTGSHMNALYKGQHRTEFTLFSIIDALPIFSIDACRAARQIVEACRDGAPTLTISIQARMLILANALAPGLTARIMALAHRLLPGPGDAAGDAARSGWESRTALAPSLLTRLADRATEQNNELRGHEPVA